MFGKYRIPQERKAQSPSPKDDLKPAGPKIILFNMVNYDGIGDFSHFVDIYLAFKKNHKMKGYHFIPAIACYNQWQYELIEQQLQDLGISYYFLALEEDFEKKYQGNESFLTDLRDAQQFISISFWDFPAMAKWQKVNPNIPFKFIGEHESDYGYKEGCARSLGLSSRHHGIKLSKLPRLTLQKAIDIIENEKEGKKFTKRLLEETKSEDFKYFDQHHFLIPAYFNSIMSWAKFINLLLLNKSLPADKNFVFFLSGNGLKASPSYVEEDIKSKSSVPNQSKLSTHLGWWLPGEQSKIKQIILAEAKYPNSIIYPINSEEKRTIFIFYGFKLGKAGYEALYQQAPLAGVSGDNTFELAASLALPYYLPTSTQNKSPTSRRLIAIIKKLKLPDEVIKDFTAYFLLNAESHSYLEEEKIFKEINLTAMIKAWPVIADCLIKHHNFYDRLESIFFESRFKMQLSFHAERAAKKCQSLSSNRNILYAAAIAGTAAVGVAASLYLSRSSP